MIDGLVVAVKKYDEVLNTKIKNMYGEVPIYQISNEKAQGICSKYNHGIDKVLNSNCSGWTVFAHDDAVLKSNDLNQRLQKMSDAGADIVGVAGNVSIPKINPGYWWDGLTTANFRGSGAVIHRTPGSQGMFHIESYGPYPQPVAALDGVWIAVKTEKFKNPSLRWESNFPGYHYYDADFCATARSLNLKIWVADILILHDKWGKGIEDPAFKEHQQLFIKKWSKKKHLYYKGQPSKSNNPFIKGTTAFK